MDLAFYNFYYHRLIVVRSQLTTPDWPDVYGRFWETAGRHIHVHSLQISMVCRAMVASSSCEKVGGEKILRRYKI